MKHIDTYHMVEGYLKVFSLRKGVKFIELFNSSGEKIFGREVVNMSINKIRKQFLEYFFHPENKPRKIVQLVFDF